MDYFRRVRRGSSRLTVWLPNQGHDILTSLYWQRGTGKKKQKGGEHGHAAREQTRSRYISYPLSMNISEGAPHGCQNDQRQLSLRALPSSPGAVKSRVRHVLCKCHYHRSTLYRISRSADPGVPPYYLIVWRA